MKSGRRWRKTKIAAVLLAICTVAFFSVFNTSTRYGRWLFWQDADWGDMNRFASRMVKNDSALKTKFKTENIDESVRKAIADFRIKDESLVEFAASHESTALIVVHDGKLVLEEYFQNNRRDSLQMSVSCTKSIVSLLVGFAIEDALIDSIDDPITKYVEGLQPSMQDVSIRHLMTMTSGISETHKKLFDAIPAPWSDKVAAYYDPNFRNLATTFDREYQPGSRFEYHDFNPILIGMMLEQVTGKNLSDYLSQKVWQPAGMNYQATWSLDSNRYRFEKTASGINATAIDMARLGWLLIDPNQNWISRTWIATSVEDDSASELLKAKFATSAQRAAERNQQSLSDHISGLRYGLYWWRVERDGRTDFYANGHFGQFIYVSPAAKLVIVRNGTGHGGLNDWYFGDFFFQLATKIIESVREPPAKQQ